MGLKVVLGMGRVGMEVIRGEWGCGGVRTYHLGGVVAAGNVGLLEEGAQGRLWGQAVSPPETKGEGKHALTPPHTHSTAPPPRSPPTTPVGTPHGRPPPHQA